ncbi:MAG: sigma-54-dependent Fis family transcriptional regulator [Deltaproteobacteria bacterium]|nr:sigma-54-dependent Fis family transcriptional regulator [Deltaproteobacteria bacterium]
MPRILIADNDGSFSEALLALLSKEGFEMQKAQDPPAILEALQGRDIDLALLEVDLRQGAYLELLRQAQELSPRTLVVLIASQPSVETAIAAIRHGAQDYFLKPVPPEEVANRIIQLIELRHQAEEVQFLRRRVHRDYEFLDVIGKSKSLKDLLGIVTKVAPTQTTVLISGESGTGKELIARAIHAHSDRKDKLFLPVNCGALPETLLESLLFGHLKGSFTGAFANQEGLFEKARGGTIFLDEIGEIPQHLQVKLLRALEAKEILPIGSTTPRRIDVRVLAATNRDLLKEVEAGRFRDDLYYRLNIMEIHIPPLRERPEDIPLLVEHLVQKHNPELKKNFRGADGAVIRTLMSLPWKGNVRELDNVIEHTMILADGDWIALEHLPRAITEGKDTPPPFTYELKEALRQYERQHIRRVLEEVGQDRKEAARLLDISLSSLYRKIEELGIA